jgi:hypothetical protein
MEFLHGLATDPEVRRFRPEFNCVKPGFTNEIKDLVNRVFMEKHG